MLLNNIRALIKTVPAYNQALLDKKGTALSDMPAQARTNVKRSINLAYNPGKAYNSYLTSTNLTRYSA